MGLAREEARSAGLTLEVLEQALASCAALEAAGLGERGTQALIHHYQPKPLTGQGRKRPCSAVAARRGRAPFAYPRKNPMEGFIRSKITMNRKAPVTTHRQVNSRWSQVFLEAIISS